MSGHTFVMCSPCPRHAVTCKSCSQTNAAGDGVTHLAWRLRHGEVPFDKGHRPKIVILHAGTNGAQHLLHTSS